MGFLNFKSMSTIPIFKFSSLCIKIVQKENNDD